MGPWGIAALVLVGGIATEKGRKVLRDVTKSVVKAGYVVTKKSSTALGEIKEEIADVVAEVKAEQGIETTTASEEVKTKAKKKPASETETAS
jgi:hypothetical protein